MRRLRSPSSEQVYCSCGKGKYGKMIESTTVREGVAPATTCSTMHAKDWYCASCRDSSLRTDVVQDPIVVSGDDEPPCASDGWIQNQLYNSDKETILRDGGWLQDNVITCAQNLLAQQYPHVGGLQPPVLTKRNQFAVQGSQFVQILSATITGSQFPTLLQVWER